MQRINSAQFEAVRDRMEKAKEHENASNALYDEAATALGFDPGTTEHEQAIDDLMDWVFFTATGEPLADAQDYLTNWATSENGAA